MNILVFILAAILSMPKQFITVYIGTLLESSSNGTSSVHFAVHAHPEAGSATTKNKILSYVVGFITVLVTIAAMWYIQREVNRIKPDVVYARRKARSVSVPVVERHLISHHSQAKLNGDDLYQNGGATGSNDDTIFNPNVSDVSLTTPLTRSDAPYDSHYQQWDKEGRAVGYTADPRVYAPQPRRANVSFDAGFIAPPRTGSVPGASTSRQESTDTARWELQTNAADGQAYAMHGISESVEPLQNPFENASSETIISPSGPIPTRSPAGEYAFSAPQHSFEGNSSKPPGYRA